MAADKAFHVSPFMDLEGRYLFELDAEPGGLVSVRIDEERGGDSLLPGRARGAPGRARRTLAGPGARAAPADDVPGQRADPAAGAPARREARAATTASRPTCRARVRWPHERTAATGSRRGSSRCAPSTQSCGASAAGGSSCVLPDGSRRSYGLRGRTCSAARGARLGVPAPACALATHGARRGLPGARVADARPGRPARAVRGQLRADRRRGRARRARAHARADPASAPAARPARVAAGRTGALRPLERVLRALARPVHDLLLCGLRDAGAVARGRPAAQVPPALRPARARPRAPPARDRHRLGRHGDPRGARARLPRHDHHDLDARSTSSPRAAWPRRALADRVEVLERDYRTLTGTYDRIVSIEMLEAIGHDQLPTYFRSARPPARAVRAPSRSRRSRSPSSATARTGAPRTGCAGTSSRAGCCRRSARSRASARARAASACTGSTRSGRTT